MAAFDSLSASLTVQLQYEVGLNSPTPNSGKLTFQDHKPPQTTISKKQSYTVGTGAGQANLVYGNYLSIAPSGNTSIDLSSLVDVLGRTTNWTKLKAVHFWLVSTADDSTYGSACSSVTIGNGTNPNGMFLSVNTTTFVLNNGEQLAWSTGSAGGITVDGSNKTIKIVNNDGAVAAKVCVVLFGVGT